MRLFLDSIFKKRANPERIFKKKEEKVSLKMINIARCTFKD